MSGGDDKKIVAEVFNLRGALQPFFDTYQGEWDGRTCAGAGEHSSPTSDFPYDYDISATIKVRNEKSDDYYYLIDDDNLNGFKTCKRGAQEYDIGCSTTWDANTIPSSKKEIWKKIKNLPFSETEDIVKLWKERLSKKDSQVKVEVEKDGGTYVATRTDPSSKAVERLVAGDDWLQYWDDSRGFCHEDGAGCTNPRYDMDDIGSSHLDDAFDELRKVFSKLVELQVAQAAK